MKITRRQLRKMIHESVRLKYPVFDEVTAQEIEDLRIKARKEAEIAGKINPEQKIKLRKIAAAPNGKEMARELYIGLGSEEPIFSPSQELEFLKGQENYKQNLYNDNYLEICKMILRGGSSMMKGIDLAIKFDALPRQHNLYPGDPYMNGEIGRGERSIGAKASLVLRMEILNDEFKDIVLDQMKSTTNSDYNTNFYRDNVYRGVYDKPVLDNEDYLGIHYDLFISKRNARPRYQRILTIAIYCKDAEEAEKMLSDFNNIVNQYSQRSFTMEDYD